MKKLQIILVGNEWDRLIYPIKEHNPDKVVLLCQDEPKFSEENEQLSKIAEKITKKIRFSIICETKKVKTHDFKEVTTTLLNIIKENKEYDDITINISAGSKIMVATSIMVSQYYGCKVSYIIPKEYGDLKSGFYAKGALKEVNIPVLNISKLIKSKGKEKEIFLCIERDPITLTQLINKYFNKTVSGTYESRTIKSLFLYHLKKLSNKNLIFIDNTKRNTLIWLSDTGEFIKEITKYS